MKQVNTAPKPILDTIPEELRVLPQWRPWKFIPPKKPGEKPGKEPLSAFTLLTSNDTDGLRDCTSFDQLASMLIKEQQKPYSQQRFHGIGLSLNFGEYTVLDFDRVISEEGVLDPRAEEIMMSIPGYVERSVSGIGYHLITKLKDWGDFNYSDPVWGMEIFRGKKFIAITGDMDSKYSKPIPADPVSTDVIRKHYSKSQVSTNSVEDLFKRWCHIDQNMSLDEAEKLVMAIQPQTNPGFSRQFWLNIGMALHFQFQGAHEALEIWDKYSEQPDAGEYLGFNDLEFAWNSFQLNKSSICTAATLRYYASEYPREKKIEDDFILEKFKPIQYITDKLFVPNYVIDGFLATEIITIAGAPGIGKSSMLVPLAAMAAHLCDPNDPLKPKLRRKVVYMTEDPKQVITILYGLRKHGGITCSNDEMREWFNIIPTLRSSKDELAALIRTYSNSLTVNQSGKKGSIPVPPLFVFDTAPATFSLDNENDNSEVSAAISTCKQACFETSTPLWIVAHIAKALNRAELKELSIRGAGAWAGDVHGTAFIGMDKGVENKRFMILGKKRHVPAFDTIEFEAHFHSCLAEDALGDLVEVPYMFGAARKSSTQERVVNQGLVRNNEIRQKIIQVISQFNSEDTPINRSNLKQRIGGNHSVLTGMIDQLIFEGVIEEYEYPNKTNNRQKHALRITQAADFPV